MADRVVKVSLQASVSNYLAGMESARKATASVGTEAEQAKAKLENQSQAMTNIGTGMIAVGAIAAVGIGLAIKKFADFDAAMSEVQASTHESAANMGLLRDAAIEAGASTVFTATEAANAIDELAKAGVSTADVLNGALAGSLDLASAGGLGVADAASIAATALTQFKLKGSEIPHVADLLAAGAGKAQGSVDDLGQALKQGGLVASQAGLSLDETTGALAAFASAGLVGSDAGTSFKTMLLALEKPSKLAQDSMDQYGISVYDSNGKMKSMSDIAGILQDKLGGLTDEQRNSTLATIFGTDAVRSAAVLYDQGADGIQAWNDKVNDSGYAAETARIKLDNLNGDLEKLGGAFDTALIGSASGANTSLRALVQTVTSLVDVFNGAPPIVQQAALGLGVVAAGALLTGGAFLVGVPKIAAFQLALATLSESTMPGVASSAVKMQGAVTKAGSALSSAGKFLAGPWGLALAAAAVGVALLSNYLDSLKASSDEISNSLKTAATAGEIFAKVGEGRQWTAAADVAAQLNDLPALLQEATDQSANFFDMIGGRESFGAIAALKDIGTELSNVASSDLPEAQREFRLLSAETDGTAQSQWRLLASMPAYKDALTEQATQLGINVTSSDEAANKTALLKLAFGSATPTALDAADAYLAAADEASGMNDQVKALMDSLNELNGKNQDATSATIDYQNALQDIKDAMSEIDPATGKAREASDLFQFTLDQTTQSGRDNMGMLIDLAQKNQAAAQAVFDADGNTANYRSTLEAGRQSIYDTAIAMGANADEAKRIADNIAGIPSETDFKIVADTAEAAARLQHLRDLIANVTGAVALGPGVTINPYLLPRGPNSAEGGMLPGAPSSKDNMFIHAASGEFVTRSSQAAIPANRAALEYMNRGGTIRGYASGGLVGYTPPIQYAPAGGYSGRDGSSAPSQTVQHITITAPAIETQDALTYATVMGREFGRQVAG